MGDDTTILSSGALSPHAFQKRLMRDYELQRQKAEEADYKALEAHWQPILTASEHFTQTWEALPALSDGAQRDVVMQHIHALWEDFRVLLQRSEMRDLSTMWESTRLPESVDPTPEEMEHSVRAPRGVLSLIADVRMGAVQTPRLVRQDLFLAPQHQRWEYWEFRPTTSELSLAVSFPPGVRPSKRPGVSAREVLTPATLRAYLASLCLAMERNQEGMFPPDYKKILLDYFGVPERKRTRAGREYTELPSTPLQMLQGQLDVLSQIYLMGTQRAKISAPQALLTRVEWNGEEVWQHAPFAWQLTRRSFTQIPRAVLRLDPQDVPLALGIASLWRHRIVPEVLKGSGFVRAPLSQLASEFGEDVAAGRRRHGAHYWPRLIERLIHTMQVGKLGTLHADTTRKDPIITLTPSDALASGYQPLMAAQARAADRADRAAVEAGAHSLKAPRVRHLRTR